MFGKVKRVYAHCNVNVCDVLVQASAHSVWSLGKSVNLNRLVCVVPPCEKHEDQVIGVEPGRAGRGHPGQGRAQQDWANQGKAKQSRAGQSKQGRASLIHTRHTQSGQGSVRQGRAEQAGQGKPDPHKTYTVRAGQCKAGQGRAGQIQVQPANFGLNPSQQCKNILVYLL